MNFDNKTWTLYPWSTELDNLFEHVDLNYECDNDIQEHESIYGFGGPSGGGGGGGPTTCSDTANCSYGDPGSCPNDYPDYGKNCNGDCCGDVLAANFSGYPEYSEQQCAYHDPPSYPVADCAGECGGDAVIDDCGTCDGGCFHESGGSTSTCPVICCNGTKVCTPNDCPNNNECQSWSVWSQPSQRNVYNYPDGTGKYPIAPNVSLPFVARYERWEYGFAGLICKCNDGETPCNDYNINNCILWTVYPTDLSNFYRYFAFGEFFYNSPPNYNSNNVDYCIEKTGAHGDDEWVGSVCFNTDRLDCIAGSELASVLSFDPTNHVQDFGGNFTGSENFETLYQYWLNDSNHDSCFDLLTELGSGWYRLHFKAFDIDNLTGGSGVYLSDNDNYRTNSFEFLGDGPMVTFTQSDSNISPENTNYYQLTIYDVETPEGPFDIYFNPFETFTDVNQIGVQQLDYTQGVPITNETGNVFGLQFNLEQQYNFSGNYVPTISVSDMSNPNEVRELNLTVTGALFPTFEIEDFLVEVNPCIEPTDINLQLNLTSIPFTDPVDVQIGYFIEPKNVIEGTDVFSNNINTTYSSITGVDNPDVIHTFDNQFLLNASEAPTTYIAYAIFSSDASQAAGTQLCTSTDILAEIHNNYPGTYCDHALYRIAYFDYWEPTQSGVGITLPTFSIQGNNEYHYIAYAGDSTAEFKQTVQQSVYDLMMQPIEWNQSMSGFVIFTYHYVNDEVKFHVLSYYNNGSDEYWIGDLNQEGNPILLTNGFGYGVKSPIDIKFNWTF